MTAALIAGIVLAGILLRGRQLPSMPPPELTPAEHAEIAEIIRRETSRPVRWMTHGHDGTVQVHAGGDGELGGGMFQIRNVDGGWKVLRSTVLF